MANLFAGIFGRGETSTTKGTTAESSRRGFQPQMRGLGSLVTRSLLGQLAAPPETAVGVPFQQAISNLQSGFPQMRAHLGLGGGLVNQLSGRGVGGGALLPPRLQANLQGLLAQALGTPPQQFGLQSREELGLPPRESYFTFIPTPEELLAAGAVPPVAVAPSAKRLQRKEERLVGRQARLEQRIASRQDAGRPTGRAERRLGRTEARLERVRGRR
jgi:hypothetical protein